MTVMLVDDTDISNFIMRKFIEIRKPETNIHEYTDAAQALEVISQVSPDIIFLDLNMPIMNGWKFLELMRSSALNNKVAILTSSTCDEDLNKSKEFGNVVNFYVKPLTPDELARVFDDLSTKVAS